MVFRWVQFGAGDVELCTLLALRNNQR
jgi:hypothetical protein